MPLKFILIGLFMFTLLSTTAQEWDYAYTHYTKSDGLPSNTVYCVTSDKNGVLWLGTDAGVVRFDGYHMKVFNTDDGLPSNDVFEIVCDSKNRLWLTTFKREIVYILNDKIYSSDNDSLLRKITNKFAYPRFFEDSDSNLWITTFKFDLFKINKNNQLVSLKLKFRPNDVGYNFTEYDNKLYFISRHYSFFVERNSNEIQLLDSTHFNITDGLRLIGKDCFYIKNSKSILKANATVFEKGYFKARSSYWNIPVLDSILWVPSQRGFTLYSLCNLNSIKKVLSKNQVSFCHKDKVGNTWISTLSNGMFKLNSIKINNSDFGSGNNTHNFTSLLVVKDKLYAGTSKGDFFCFTKSILKFKYKFSIKAASISNVRILKIEEKNDNIYIGTDRGIYIWNERNETMSTISFNNTALKNFFFRNDSLILLDNVGIRFFSGKVDKSSLITFKRFYSYCEYNNRKVAGSQDSLYYIDKVFKPYPININFNFRAVDLLVKDSLLIATTSEKGVFFIQDSIVKKNLNSSNGFSSNTCYKSVLHKNVLYTATNKGINIYDFKTDSLFHFYESDGLPSNTVFDLSVYNDTLYAATESGLSVVPTSVIPHQRTFHYFASPVIANRDTFWNEPAQIEVYDSEPITIVLNALSYGTKSPVTYYFKIAGIDTAYRFTSDPELHLTNLSHGNYTLHSYAKNTDDVVSNPIAIELRVKPFFYQTLTFRILLVTGILLIFFLFVIWMKKAIEKRELLKSEGERRIRTLELAAWKAAFNPHFLFNSIQTLQSLFLDKDFDSANKFAAKFSAILRKTVDHSSQLFISITDEISYLQNYLELEKIKREGKLKYDIISDELCDMLFVPSLVLQVVVENSLKHGIQERSDGYINIQFVCANDRVICTIVDNGAGFNESDIGKSTSKGIQLLRNKLSSVEKLLNQTIHFNFKNRLGNAGEVIGAETFFSFPKIKTIHEISGNPG